MSYRDISPYLYVFSTHIIFVYDKINSLSLHQFALSPFDTSARSWNAGRRVFVLPGFCFPALATRLAQQEGTRDKSWRAPSYLSKYSLLDHSLECSYSEGGSSEGPSFVHVSNMCGALVRLQRTKK